MDDHVILNELSDKFEDVVAAAELMIEASHDYKATYFDLLKKSIIELNQIKNILELSNSYEVLPSLYKLITTPLEK